MSILVTGVTSGVGYYTVKQLREKYNKIEIHALYRSEQPPKNLDELDLNFVRGDLTKKTSLEKALKDIKTVFHIAG